MTDEEAQRTMVSLLTEWLRDRPATEDFVRVYWGTRRRLLDSNWTAFAGRFGELMDPVDSAMDVYNADPDRADDQIDETQLREELERVVAGIRSELPGLLAEA
jgi:hypothetical protein